MSDPAAVSVDSLISRFPGAVVRFAEHRGTFHVVEANEEATILLTAAPEDLTGAAFAEGLYQDDAARLDEALADPSRFRTGVVLRWGSVLPVAFIGLDLKRDIDGTVIAALHDRTDQLAHHDHLTGLPNRDSCFDRLDQALARTRREGRSTAVLFCRLGSLEPIDDQLGHAASDRMLVELARRYTGSIRETDTVCRFGGDEFVIICEGFDDLAGIEALTRRLIALTTDPVDLGDASVTAGLSIGVAVADATSTSVQLVANAGAAGDRARKDGPNGYLIAD